MDERRRFERRPATGEDVRMLTTSHVRVVDISAAGVLLETSRRVEAGARGRLRFSLGGTPFTADVQIRRVSPGASTGAFRLGAMFVGMTLEHRQMLDRFMANA